MSKTIIRRSERVYDFLLKLYPESYRKEFEEEMKFVFSESLKGAYAENKEQGIITLWTRTFFDLGKSLAIQYIENLKGGVKMRTMKKDYVKDNRIFLWLLAVTAALLSVPYLGMQFHLVKPNPNNPLDKGLDWSIGDFVIMAFLLYGMGSLFVFIARRFNKRYRIYIALSVLALFILIWAHLAVGLFDGLPFAGS